MQGGITVEFCHRGYPDLPGFSSDRGCAWSSRNVEAVVDSGRLTLQNDGVEAEQRLREEPVLSPFLKSGEFHRAQHAL